ncbi:MAG: hypothetical protein V4733_11485 [Verrucomicrobiota bacterium]
MKPHLPIFTALVLLTSSFLATGTPDHEVKVEERLLGSNSDGYIILRSEFDNLGSYYSHRARRFLVEYSKVPSDPKSASGLGAEVRSQLLLDVSTSSHPDEPHKISEVINFQNDDVKLAALLSRFPDHHQRWDDEKSRLIKCHRESGASLGRVDIVWGGWIKERFGADRNGDLEWTLGEVFEDPNCLYLSVHSEARGQRLVAIPPRKTQQVRDHLVKQPVYLVAGKFKNQEEAMKKAREFIEKSNGKFKPEVWSSWGGDTIYVVADSQSAAHIMGKAFEAFEATTGLDFTVMSSEPFSERFVVAPAK